MLNTLSKNNTKLLSPLIKLCVSLQLKRMRKPDKIFMENPNLIYALSLSNIEIGTVLESFFLNQLAISHKARNMSRKKL